MDIEDQINKIILGEISGKNQAIHAYDKIIWMIRTGFLTVFFVAWSILLKSIVENGSGTQPVMNDVLLVMLLISLILSVGAFIIDQNYVRRKFRVIHALDSLLACMFREDFQLSRSLKMISGYIQVSGDKDDTNYRKVSGYKPAFHAGLYVYFLPVLMAVVIVTILWKDAGV